LDFLILLVSAFSVEKGAYWDTYLILEVISLLCFFAAAVTCFLVAPKLSEPLIPRQKHDRANLPHASPPLASPSSQSESVTTTRTRSSDGTTVVSSVRTTYNPDGTITVTETKFIEPAPTAPAETPTTAEAEAEAEVEQAV
jgi:uncharacterized membrane protein